MNDLSKTLLFWKLAIFKATGKAFIAGILSVAATLNGVEWESFTTSQKVVAFSVALGSVWQVLDAFLSETMSELKQKQKDENTQAFVKGDAKNL